MSEKNYGTCFLCNVKINVEDKKFMLASDKPRFNIYVHKDCLDKTPEKELHEKIKKYLDL